MFKRGKEESGAAPATPVEPTPRPAPPTPPRPQSSRSIQSVVGSECRVIGNVDVTGSVRVDGAVEGNIRATERVQIGAGGQVTGEVEASEVHINGTVTGKVAARGLLHLVGGSHLNGDVATGRLIVEDGAVLDGSCKMEAVGEDARAVQRLEVLKPKEA